MAFFQSSIHSSVRSTPQSGSVFGSRMSTPSRFDTSFDYHDVCVTTVTFTVSMVIPFPLLRLVSDLNKVMLGAFVTLTFDLLLSSRPR